MRAWSFSSLNLYTTCPRQYYLTKVASVIPYTETEATKWGSAVHLALEEYVRDGKELSDDFVAYKKVADKILALPGERFVEKEFALTSNLEPCDFKDEAAWCRGIIDVGVIGNKKAFVGDYKTGKIRPESDQLKLFAAFIFTHYPDIEEVKTAYIWLAHGKSTVEKYKRDQLPDIWEHFMTKAEKLKRSYEKDRWVPKPSGLCNGYCGAGSSHCEFWSPKRAYR